MILMKLDGLPGKYCEIEGESQFKYSVSKEGWFPIESLSFSLKGGSESKSKGATANTNPQGAGAGKTSGAQAPANQSSKKEEDDAGSTISVSKFVDSTTQFLMLYAMEDRKKAKDEEKDYRKIDFHLLHSVRGVTETKKERYVFPYMQITLGNALIKGWSLNASGDDRPTETFEVWFEKIAMRYYSSSDGKIWTGGQHSDWDQKANDRWKDVPKTGAFEEVKKGSGIS